MKLLAEEIKRALCNPRFFAALVVAVGIAVAHVVLFIVPESADQEMYIEVVQHPMTVYSRWIGGWAETMFPFLYFYLLPLLCCLPFSDSLLEDRSNGWDCQVISRTSRASYVLAKVIACSIAAIIIAIIPLCLNFYLTCMFLPIIQPEPSSALYPIASYKMWSDVFFTNAPLYYLMYGALIAVTVALLACLPLALSRWVRNSFVLIGSSFFLCTILQYVFAGNLFEGERLVFLSPVTFMQPYQPFHSGIGIGHISVTLIVLVLFEAWCLVRQARKKDLLWES